MEPAYRQHVQSSDHGLDRNDGRRAGRRPRPAEDHGRSHGRSAAGHAQQLRRRPDALGHLSDGRGKLQRLLLDRPEGGDGKRLNKGLGGAQQKSYDRYGIPSQLVQLGQVSRALQRRQGSQRVQPLRLDRRDRSVRSRVDPGQAHRARPLPARRRRDDRQQGRPRRRLLRRRCPVRVCLPVRLQGPHEAGRQGRTTCACSPRARCRSRASTRTAR